MSIFQLFRLSKLLKFFIKTKDLEGIIVSDQLKDGVIEFVNGSTIKIIHFDGETRRSKVRFYEWDEENDCEVCYTLKDEE